MIIILFGALLPFILWPIEQLLPYPFIIEEVANAILVLVILKTVEKPLQVKVAALTGLLFAITESVFYLFNILIVGTSITLFERLALTIQLHVGTLLIILFFGQKRKEFIPIGMVIAAMIHYYFNIFVGKL